MRRSWNSILMFYLFLGEAQITGCSFLTLSAPWSWSGPTPPDLPATQAPVVRWPCVATLLVAYHDSGRRRDHCRLHDLCSKKIPQHALAGLLQPLPVPHHPWFPTSLDFFMSLTPSDGNTAIPTVVDQFSNAAHFILLSKLTSAKETAQLMMQHIFRIHGLSVDMVSDWGPQFLSWFCNVDGASTYSAFRKYSHPLTFSTFCCGTA